MRLVIDSATAACSVALLDRGNVLAETHEIVGRGHAERLLPMIADLLGGRRPSSILVDCGPGSFTGVRVGLSAAHGLAIGWDVPVSGYSSLPLIAAAADAPAESEVAVALIAGHGQLFVQTFALDPLTPIDALQSLEPAAAAEAISARLVLGSGAAALVAARGHGEAIEAVPRAADARLLPAVLQSLGATPIYGRAPDAKPMVA